MGEETFRDRLLQKMQKREFIYNRACRKVSQPFKAVYFRLPKVNFETAHAGERKQKVRLQPLALEKHRAKVLLPSKKGKESWLLLRVRGDKKEGTRSLKNPQLFLLVPRMQKKTKRKKTEIEKRKKKS